MFRGNGWVYDLPKGGEGSREWSTFLVRLMSHESHVALCNPSLPRILHD